jgi:hypothetical protein
VFILSRKAFPADAPGRILLKRITIYVTNKLMKKLFPLCLASLLVLFPASAVFPGESLPAAVPSLSSVAAKQRLIVLSDIEADPDDTESFVRLFLYSDEIDIEGLVATTSTHQKTRVAPESIRTVIGAYAKVQPNLLKHDAAYPDAQSLLKLVKQGLPVYGMNGVGEGKDSEGSDWIVKVLEENDARPLWVTVWGGPNTLAQALYKIRATNSAVEAKRLVAKLRVYTISDQDDSGFWIRSQFPELFYIVSPGGYAHGTWGAIIEKIDGIDNTTVSNGWLAANIQQGHGPLGSAYPDVAYGMEGDTPSWLSLVPNGLNAPEHPDFGGWGGRYELYKPELADLDPKGFTGGVPVEPETRPIWTNAVDQYTPELPNAYGRAVRRGDVVFESARVTLWRWRDDFQNDFAARMDWCVQPYAGANHPPVPALKHAEAITVRSGEGFTLDATGTTDPDGDSLSYLWFNYPEAGSYKKPVPVNSAENLKCVYVVAPVVDKEETTHFILKVTDKGTPALTRYKRVIVTIMPKP